MYPPPNDRMSFIRVAPVEFQRLTESKPRCTGAAMAAFGGPTPS